MTVAIRPGAGDAEAVAVDAVGNNAAYTANYPETATAARVLARRHSLRPAIAALLVNLGASGERLAA